MIDTVPITPEIKAELDQLTDNGNKIEAVVGVHRKPTESPILHKYSF